MLEITNIFTSNLENHAFPQATYLFKVVFDKAENPDGTGDLNVINTMDDAVSITATLPKTEVKTAVQWYKGTPLTRIVNMDRSGETTLTFVVRRTGLGKLGELFRVRGYDIDSDSEFIHDEFSRTFTRLIIYTLKTHMFKSDILNVKGDVEGNLTSEDEYDKDGNLVKEGNVSAKFTLYNCVVTSFNFTDLSYESSDYVKMTVVVHYDYWSCT